MGQDLERRVRERLRAIRFPGLCRDIVADGWVRAIEVEGAAVTVRLRAGSPDRTALTRLRDEVQRLVAAVDGVATVAVDLVTDASPSATQSAVARDPGLLPGVGQVVAVASGKGGVGKSTVAVNLAIRLAQMGRRIGLLDADLYGPSVPVLLGITDRPAVAPSGGLSPIEKFGIRTMSLGFVLDGDTPVIWRGPMVMKALEQLLRDVDWGELDLLVVDLPPGTGDAQLTLSQKVPLSGAVIVTTPQDLALVDARKGLAMFRRVNVPVLGIVENMSTFVCPHCGKETDVFKRGGGELTARISECRFLGRIPLDPAIMEGSDQGRPIVVEHREGPFAEAFSRVAEGVLAELGRAGHPGGGLKIV